jgi:hypothetical protein
VRARGIAFDRGDARGITRAKRDRCTLLQEPLHGRKADAGRAAGNDRDALGKLEIHDAVTAAR